VNMFLRYLQNFYEMRKQREEKINEMYVQTIAKYVIEQYDKYRTMGYKTIFK